MFAPDLTLVRRGQSWYCSEVRQHALYTQLIRECRFAGVSVPDHELERFLWAASAHGLCVETVDPSEKE